MKNEYRNSYPWWMDFEAWEFLAIVAIFAACFLAAHAMLVYLLQSIFQVPRFSYWTCYWITGVMDMIFLLAYCFKNRILSTIVESVLYALFALIWLVIEVLILGKRVSDAVISLIAFGLSEYEGDSVIIKYKK
jgi:hypothetical protein